MAVLPWAGQHILLRGTGLMKETIMAPFSVYNCGWCVFADLLHLAMVGHTTGFFIMSTWQHCCNILLWMCQECSAITAHCRYKIQTLEFGNTWFTINFSISCQITETAEFSYGPGLMGHTEWNLYVIFFFISGE
jgi:hypothetical protein